MSLLRDTADELQAEWLLLRERWESAKEHWRDGVRERFEREFWEEYERVLPAAIAEIRRLDEQIDLALIRTA